MAITVVLPASGAFSFTDIPGVIDLMAFESTVTSFNSTQFSGSGIYEGKLATYTISGSNFVTSNVGGETYVTGGVISTIDVKIGSDVAKFTNVGINMAEFSNLIFAEETGANILAVETYLLNRAWDVTLGAANDVAWSNTLIGDGVKFNPVKDDIIRGMGGNDQLFAGDGNDLVDGGIGKDKLGGGRGDDTLLGRGGADTLLGGNNNDKLNGGSGNDILNGGKGRDILTGGKGLDDFIFASKNGVNRIKDFNASDGREDINLAAVKAIKSMTDLKNNHMTQLGDNVVIDDGAATKLIILDTLLSELDRSDFIF